MDEKQKLIAEIVLLAMSVHEKTNRCVFVAFSGHVEELEIRIRASKKDWEREIADSRVYVNKEYSIKRLKQIKETLLGFIEEGEVNVDEMDYWVEEIKHYKF